MAVERWHYSHTMPRGKSLAYGAWEDGRFRGAVMFGSGAGAATDGRRFGLARAFEVAELTRVALIRHDNPVTAILAEAIRLVKDSSPGLRLLVSFADPNVGHVGRIYQAGNWVYTGRTMPSKMYVDQHGRQYHERVVSETGMKKHYGKYSPVPRPSQLEVRPQAGKFRYVFPLDRQMRRTVNRLALPYPQSADEGSTVSCADSVGEVQVQPLASALEPAEPNDVGITDEIIETFVKSH